MNRHQVRTFVTYCADKTEVVLSSEEMQTIYNRLYPYSQVPDTVKQKHVDDIIVNHVMQKQFGNKPEIHQTE